MTVKTSKFFIHSKIAMFNHKNFLSLRKGKLGTRSDRRSPFCLTFDTLEDADKFLQTNKDFFIRNKEFEYVSINSFEVDANRNYHNHNSNFVEKIGK